MITEKFAERLKKLRNDSNLSLEELAHSLGVTAQSLSLYERAKRTINIDLLYQISKYFNVSADYLLGLTDVPSLDTDVQGVCKYTGLSEKAINEIREYNSYQFKGTKGNPISYPTEDGDALNFFLENPYIWDIISQLTKLKKESEKDFCFKSKITVKNMFDGSPKINELLQQNEELINEKRKIYEKCDVIILRIYRFVKFIIDEFDKRNHGKNCEDEDFII